MIDTESAAAVQHECGRGRTWPSGFSCRRRDSSEYDRGRADAEPSALLDTRLHSGPETAAIDSMELRHPARFCARLHRGGALSGNARPISSVASATEPAGGGESGKCAAGLRQHAEPGGARWVEQYARSAASGLQKRRGPCPILCGGRGSYTWSHNIDDSTAAVSSTVFAPRRPQDSQSVRSERASSMLDHRTGFQRPSFMKCRLSKIGAGS